MFLHLLLYFRPLVNGLLGMTVAPSDKALNIIRGKRSIQYRRLSVLRTIAIGGGSIMLRLKQALGSCMLASALLPTVEGCQHYFAVAHAATYYVDTAGSDSHPGTEKQPWRTVAYAVSKMVAGDTTYVRGGTYNEGLIRFSRTGTQAAPIKLLNYPGESPIINFIDPKQFPRILIQHASRINVAMGWITIEGFEIAHGYDGIKYYNLHDSTIRRNWIHHSLNQGILGGGGHHNTFDRNIINHNGGTFDACAATGANLDCNQRHGFYLHGNFYTIINNLIYDNLAFGIQVNGSSTSAYSSTKHPSPEFAGASDWVISNNVFAYQYAATGIVLWGGLVNRVRIENNIFYENNTNGGSSQGIFLRVWEGQETQSEITLPTLPHLVQRPF